MGADEIVISKNEAEMQKHGNSFDFILDTVSAEHDLNAYLNLLKRDGTMTLVGAPPKPPEVQIFGLLIKRRQLAGSGIGGIRDLRTFFRDLRTTRADDRDDGRVVAGHNLADEPSAHIKAETSRSGSLRH